MSKPNILIVDDEKSLLLSMREAFESLTDRYHLHTAENGKPAIAILRDNPIDLVVTDIRMPEMDGFELILHLNTFYPMIPIIVMTAFGTREIEARLSNIGIIRFLDKPVGFQTLLSSIEDGLRRGSSGGSMTGISVGSFLQLLELEEKTCFLDVQTHGKKGLFYLNRGVLFDAVCDNKVGEEAAIEMITWNQVKLRLKNPPEQKIIRRIQSDIMALLMEASRRKDELSDPGGELDELPEYAAVSENISGSDLNRYVMEPTSPYSTKEIPTFDTAVRISSPSPDAAPLPRNLPIHQLEDLLHQVADEIDGIGFIGVFDRDGIRLAGYPPSFLMADAYSAHLSALLNMGRKSVKALTGEVDLEEQMIQTKQSWIICRPVNAAYYLGIVTDKSSGLGAIRLVFHKHIETLKNLM